MTTTNTTLLSLFSAAAEIGLDISWGASHEMAREARASLFVNQGRVAFRATHLGELEEVSLCHELWHVLEKHGEVDVDLTNEGKILVLRGEGLSSKCCKIPEGLIEVLQKEGYEGEVLRSELLAYSLQNNSDLLLEYIRQRKSTLIKNLAQCKAGYASFKKEERCLAEAKAKALEKLRRSRAADRAAWDRTVNLILVAVLSATLLSGVAKTWEFVLSTSSETQISQ
jgi:hypothetical protein